MSSTRIQPGSQSARAVGARRATRGARKSSNRGIRAPGQRLPGQVPSHRLLLACTAIVALGLLSVLFVNAALSQGAFRQHELEIALIYAAEKEELLARKVQVDEAPATLERKALALGMVPAGSPVFLDLSSGKIRGEPVPAPSPTISVSIRADELTAPPERLAKQLLVPAPSAAAGVGTAGSAAPSPAAVTSTTVQPLPPGSGAAAQVGSARELDTTGQVAEGPVTPTPTDGPTLGTPTMQDGPSSQPITGGTQ